MYGISSRFLSGCPVIKSGAPSVSDNWILSDVEILAKFNLKRIVAVHNKGIFLQLHSTSIRDFTRRYFCCTIHTDSFRKSIHGIGQTDQVQIWCSIVLTCTHSLIYQYLKLAHRSHYTVA